MMLRLLLLTLLFTLKASATETDGSGYFPNDDEQDEEQETTQGVSDNASEKKTELGYVAESDDGSTAIIIIAAVCVVALAIVAITAVVLFKRHLQRREQGVYSVPVEQDQKCI